MSLATAAVEVMMHGLLNASDKKPKQDKDGNSVFKLPLFYAVLGFISAIGGFVFLLFGVLYSKPGEEAIVLCMFFVFEALGVPLILAGLMIKIVLTPTAIKQTNLIGKEKEIKWREINSLSFDKITLELKIKSKFTTIKAHQHMVGYPYLAKEIIERTGLGIT